MQPNPVIVSLVDWNTEDGGGEFDIEDEEVDVDVNEIDDDDSDDGDDDDEEEEEEDGDDDVEEKEEEEGEGDAAEEDKRCFTVCKNDDICKVCGEKDLLSESVIVEWVQCDVCDCWQHEKCAGVVGLSESDMFVCDRCRIVLHK